MTDNRTTLLLCPFCGGEAEVIEADYGMYITGYAVYCRKCCLKLGVTGRLGEAYEWSPVFNTEAEAIEAWNTRTDDYERAAEYWQRMYAQTFAERTCHDTGENEWHFVCSACGYEQNGYECWNYCPNCGARVIGG